LEERFRAIIVLLILNGEVERALNLLSKKYDIKAPDIRIGLPKGRKTKALGCYNGRTKVISVLNSDTLKDPLVILHEFYHHLRTGSDMKHKGTEKYANAFAQEFIHAYRSVAVSDGK
jgi:hypothetical protein